jgi:hypothetical protein
VDELSEKLERAAAEIEAALGDLEGEIDVDFTYADEITLTGNRVGYARLAIETLRTAVPPPDTRYAEPPNLNYERLSSPFQRFLRVDATAEPQPPSWKDRLLGIGCVALALSAILVFVRGCHALSQDAQRWLR